MREREREKEGEREIERERATHIHKCLNVRGTRLRTFNDEVLAVRIYLRHIFFLFALLRDRGRGNLFARPTRNILYGAHHLSPYLSLRHPLSR